MNCSSPQSNDPTGALNPFDRQKVSELAGAASVAAGTPSATAALKILAPSM